MENTLTIMTDTDKRVKEGRREKQGGGFGEEGKMGKTRGADA